MEREGALSWQRAQLPRAAWTLSPDLPVQSSIFIASWAQHTAWTQSPMASWSYLPRVIHSHDHYQKVVPWTWYGLHPVWSVGMCPASDHSSPSPCSPAQEGWGGTVTPRPSDCCSLLLKWNILQGLCSILIPTISYPAS